jgi:hypothetical protein
LYRDTAPGGFDKVYHRDRSLYTIVFVPRLRTSAESLYHDGKNRTMPRFRRPYEIASENKKFALVPLLVNFAQWNKNGN